MAHNLSLKIQMCMLALGVFVECASYAQISNDRENYNGDTLRISVNAPATTRGGAAVCLPGGTSMIVVGQKDTSVIVKLKAAAAKKPSCDASPQPLSDSEPYEIQFADLKISGVARTGVTYGALVVPFKYHLTGAKDFTGSASVGGYSGYRFETLRALGTTATPVIFLGASNIAVPGSAGGSSTNVMGFSGGLGVIATFKGAFQTGVVVGWDRVGKSVGYQYDGKPWIALEIGYSFLQ